MSRNEWEHGTLKLPTAEFARVRQAVETAERARKERVFTQTQAFWKGLTRKQQTDAGEYRKAAMAFTHRLYTDGEVQATGGWYGRPGRPAPNADIAFAVQSQLECACWRTPDGTTREQHSPRRVLQADMDYPTNRTTTFHDGGASLVFDRASSTVEWDVPENNHAVEHARATAMGRAFFGALETVQWTRGTGGWFTGNDEYNQEGREYGGGATYVTTGFGPAAAADVNAQQATQPYRDSTGKLVRVEDFPGRKAFERAIRQASRGGGRGTQGRQPRGVPVGGQFTTSSRWETGTVLR